MGFLSEVSRTFNELRKVFTTDWDDSKIECQHPKCDKLGSEKMEWICVSCLFTYCGKHSTRVKLYEPNIENVSGSELANFVYDNMASNNRRENDVRNGLIREHLDIWKRELSQKGLSPYGWGPMSHFEIESVKSKGYVSEIGGGYIVCENCIGKIKQYDLHERILTMSDIDIIESNWSQLVMDDRARERISEKY